MLEIDLRVGQNLGSQEHRGSKEDGGTGKKRRIREK